MLLASSTRQLNKKEKRELHRFTFYLLIFVTAPPFQIMMDSQIDSESFYIYCGVQNIKHNESWETKTVVVNLQLLPGKNPITALQNLFYCVVLFCFLTREHRSLASRRIESVRPSKLLHRTCPARPPACLFVCLLGIEVLLWSSPQLHPSVCLGCVGLLPIT